MKTFFGLLLILAVLHETPAREVTHEDIRDAMLSLVHIVRNSEDKLERHEFREKTLGEILKKALANLDKRHKSLDPLKGAVSRLDERLSNVETILMQKDEREKEQAQKTKEMIDSLKGSLQNWSDSVAQTIRSEISNIPKPVIDNSAANEKLNALENKMSSKIDSVMTYLKNMKSEIDFIKDKQSENNCKQTNLDQKALARHMSETEQLLNKYEVKLNEYDTNITRIQTEIVPLEGLSMADDAWHSKMSEALEKQQQSLVAIQKSLKSTEEVIKSMATDGNLEKYKNETLEALNVIHYDVISSTDKGVLKLQTGLTDMQKQSKASSDEISSSITDLNTYIETSYSDIVKRNDKLQSEIQSLANVERVLIQTADNVLDTKKRIEYGIHQILLEVSKAITLSNKDLNATIQSRFDDIEMSILDNKTGALANLSKKIESEMTQVWRQIGIVYQQLTNGNSMLDKLQMQSEQYVNESVNTMESMAGKVGKITSSMMEVDDNLNFLLGRLSLVTQEFNQIRTGLGKALDDIKGSFLLVQKKIKDAGPGPHYIDEKESI